MLRVPIPRCALQHDGRNHVQPPDDLPRVVEPPHLGVAGGEDAKRESRTVLRIPLDHLLEQVNWMGVGWVQSGQVKSAVDQIG